MPQELRSCGFLIVRAPADDPISKPSFLLMKHADRWDVPKGHVDAGEDDLTCALRELWEETGITSDDIEFDSRFRYESHYEVRSKRTGNRPTPKTLVIFLARLKHDAEIHVTEHLGYAWFPWQPPHRIQSLTIDPLLEAFEQHLARSSELCDGRRPQNLPSRT